MLKRRQAGGQCMLDAGHGQELKLRMPPRQYNIGTCERAGPARLVPFFPRAPTFEAPTLTIGRKNTFFEALPAAGKKYGAFDS